MENASNATLYFGDLHFHTHYSDNRDQASIEAMILEGVKYNLSIFGTADHNHNLDAEKWRQTQEETEILRKKYPEILILNNCEITFLLGHLNVLLPEHIEGTIEEGYHYLYLEKNARKIINHPFPSTDEWHNRLLPDALGIEVINGSVFTRARKQDYHIHSALDIPSVHTYATYLSLGFPVAAIGSSDAHQKAELGFGMTGFWFTGKPNSQSVLEAIKACRTFATTRSQLILDWTLNEVQDEISWTIHWKNDFPSKKNFTVEIYHGNQKIHTALGNGKISINKAGLYWIAVFDDGDIAISSPIHVTHNYPEEKYSRQTPYILQKALRYIHQDVTWLNIQPEQIFSQTTSLTFRQGLELQMISGSDSPQIVDTLGRNISYEVIKRGGPRMIIDKECDARGFDEFYLWLKRNEIHEYIFVKIEYQKIDQTLGFTGYLLPKKMVHREGVSTLYHDDLETLRTLVDKHTTLKIHVSTLPTLIVNLHPDTTAFPLKAFDEFTGLTSVFYYDAQDGGNCPVHILNRFKKGWRYDGRPSINEKIYQVFV